MTVPVSPKRTALLAAARERILVLDGAMGTMIQGLQYDEAAFRGERFKDFHRDVRGNNDLLILTQPKAIEDIHADYLRAGADIVATNTFSSTSIAQADYDLSGIAYEMNREGAKLARAGGVLEFGAPRQADHGRLQLRARRRGFARAYRRYRPRRRHAGLRLSERRPAQRIRPVRRNPGIYGAADWRIRKRRPRQYRRRLLRHHARSYRGDCSRGRATPTARD